MKRPGRWIWRIFAVFLVLLGLSWFGYWLGERGSLDEPAIDPDKPIVTTPDCDEVWQEGKQLPDDYTGCRNQSGTFKEPIEIICFNRHGNWLIALPDGEIHEGGMCR